MSVVPFVVFIGGMVGLIGSHKRILNALLSFEMIMLSLLGFLGLWMEGGLGDLMFVFFFIVFMVGEGVLGLGLLVGLIRWHGGDGSLGLGVMMC